MELESINEEIIAALDAFLAIGEMTSFNGFLDESKDEEERNAKIEKAHETLSTIAERKGITVGELGEKVLTIAIKAADEGKKED